MAFKIDEQTTQFSLRLSKADADALKLEAHNLGMPLANHVRILLKSIWLMLRLQHNSKINHLVRLPYLLLFKHLRDIQLVYKTLCQSPRFISISY